MRRRVVICTPLTLTVLAACTVREQPQDAAVDRDVTLPPVEAQLDLNDRALEARPARGVATPVPTLEPLVTWSPERAAQSRRPAPLRAVSAPTERVARRRVGAGTYLTVTALDAVSSRESSVGDQVQATVAAPVVGSDGAIVIPAGAVFRGRVAGIKYCEGAARVTLAFDAVEWGRERYPIEAKAFDVAGRRSERGPTLGDVAGGLASGFAAAPMLAASRRLSPAGGIAAGGNGVVTGGPSIRKRSEVSVDSGAPIELVFLRGLELTPVIVR